MSHPLRLELTIFEPKLHREKAVWSSSSRSTLLFCTRYEDAVSPPFPAEGKQGVSVWVGPVSAFKDPKARLLWELEKRRKRPTVVVLTSQKGRSFLRAYREVASLLGDTALVPMSFLRRSGKGWDSLDFFSPGDSSFMEGANPRLKRLKQAGWEYLVDGACMSDPAVKREYFESLGLPRERLLEATGEAFRQLKMSPLIGIAGEGLSQESLYGLLEEPLLRRVLDQAEGQEPPPAGEWLLLAHSGSGSELSLLGHGVTVPKVGTILNGIEKSGKGRAELAVSSELAVSEVCQTLRDGSESDGGAIFCRVKVDWRYPPDREIPTKWKEKTSSLAGSNLLNG